MNFVKILWLFLAVPSITEAQEDKGIHFEKGLGWEQVKTKAKDENKYIFVDCFATWCGPCKEMDEKVYTNDSVGDYVNAKFISARLQMDKTNKDDKITKDWYRIADNFNGEFKIGFLPTYLFFTPSGELVHRAGSYQDPQDFISTAKKALDPESQYYTLLAEYNKGHKDSSKFIYLLDMAKKLGDDSLVTLISADYENYLLSLKQEDLYTFQIIDFIATGIQTSNSKFFAMFYPNGGKVNSVMKDDQYARRITDSVIAREIIEPEINFSLKQAKEPDWDSLIRIIRKRFNSSYAERNVLWSRIMQFWINDKSKMPEFLEYFAKFVQLRGMDTSFIQSDAFMNYVAYSNIFENSSNIKYIDVGVDFMRGVVRRSLSVPEWSEHTIDTYGQLLYKAGRKKEAIFYMEQAGQIAEQLNDTGRVHATQEIIEKMKKGIQTWTANFSGLWRLEKDEIVEGKVIKNVFPLKLNVDQKDDSITISNMTREEKKVKRSMKYNLQINGKPKEFITQDKRKEIQNVQRNIFDQSSLTITSSYNFDENNTSAQTQDTTVWALSFDGTKLTMNKKIANILSDDHYVLKAIYKKL